MLKNVISPIFSVNNESYYFAIYIPSQESWFICNYKFLLTKSKTTLLGQYISSLWFKMKINIDNFLQIAIIKHPESTLTISQKQRYINLLNISDDIKELDFVAVYSNISTDKLEQLSLSLQTAQTGHLETSEGVHLSFCKNMYSNNLNKNIALYCPSFYLSNNTK
tara:strand:- start:500 stop:994 length:495 start_codon:yes stop_codon:yes gene_type:complete